MSDYNNMEIRCKRAEQKIAELHDELAQANAALDRATARIDALLRQFAPETVPQ